jgi:cephalosporin-C deacetylase
MNTDLDEAALRTYRSTQTEPDDFDDFWRRTLAEAREHDLAVQAEPVDTGLTTVDVLDVSFSGADGQRVRAWLRVPAGAAASGELLPTVVEFVGYGGGRGHAQQNLFWASVGFAHLQMDTRGQGSLWSTGDTPDSAGSGPAADGVMTRGIESPESYYYRRVYTDGVRAVEAARSLDVVDADRVAVLGTSQGGGITLAVAGLVDGLVAAVPRVPFLCDFRRASVITDSDPYKQIGRYLAVHRHRAEAVHEVLSYFDGVNFARRATAPALFSTALMDATCPPSTVFGAFEAYAGEKQITVWPYNGHEGGGVEDDLEALAMLRGAFGL